MGVKLKLSDEAPEQHVAILALAGVMIFISVISSLGGSSKNEEPTQRGTYLETGETLYKNPQLSWYEKYLCRGYTRSSICRFRFLHPLVNEYELQVEEAPPVSKDKVIHYRGPLPNNRGVSGKVVMDNYY